MGYRPFIYSLAAELRIRGWVNNSSDGLYIHAEGDNLEKFYIRLLQEKPALASILSIEKEEVPFGNYPDFSIVQSKDTHKKDVLISPDVATCEDCVAELFDLNDRRYHYPFINCTNCGPRYSIIYDRPYDRNKTTMGSFVMCDACREEYTNPLNRRFHAQPIACAKCGPQVKLLDKNGNEVQEYGLGIELLEKGYILAVKGIGGYHLVCDAANEESVSRLRERKERGSKPFAIMARNLGKARDIAWIMEKEEQVLSDPAAPIVLLPKKPGSDTGSQVAQGVAPGVAPGLHTLGIMLPYTPLHYLLFQGRFDYLVMTSANLSGRPLIYTDNEALKELNAIADYFLVHNRDIFHPIDDSIVQLIDGEIAFMRRARGYVPFPVLLTDEMSGPVCALGGEMKNSFCLASGNMAFMSQYIGDMHGYENLERFNQEFQTYQKAVHIFPEKIGCDLHPEYASSRIAREMGMPMVAIQHHHAHHVSVMVEHGLDQPLPGLICDGTGYGEDGRIWGFEYIYGDKTGYARKGHLEYLPLPGGDAAAKFPLRIAYAYTKTLFDESEWKSTEPLWSKLPCSERKILDAQLRSGLHLYETSSAGRLFDAVSGLLGICTEVTYEGQAAIELESCAFGAKTGDLAVAAAECVKWTHALVHSLTSDVKVLIDEYNTAMTTDGQAQLYPFTLRDEDGMVRIEAKLLFVRIISELQRGQSIQEIALRFHYSLACAMINTALVIGVGEKLVVGGGVFHNKLLTEVLFSLARALDIDLVYPRKLPAGDGGLALGQVIIANHALR